MLLLLRRALFASFDDGLFTIAKGAAYSALLSFFPVLATAATVLVQMRADFVQRNILIPPHGSAPTPECDNRGARFRHEEQARVQGLRYRGTILRTTGWGIRSGVLRRGTCCGWGHGN